MLMCFCPFPGGVLWLRQRWLTRSHWDFWDHDDAPPTGITNLSGQCNGVCANGWSDVTRQPLAQTPMLFYSLHRQNLNASTVKRSRRRRGTRIPVLWASSCARCDTACLISVHWRCFLVRSALKHCLYVQPWATHIVIWSWDYKLSSNIL